jgi:hypothetical protein
MFERPMGSNVIFNVKYEDRYKITVFFYHVISHAGFIEKRLASIALTVVEILSDFE